MIVFVLFRFFEIIYLFIFGINLEIISIILFLYYKKNVYVWFIFVD